MKNISIASVAGDAESMMRSMLGKAEADQERERNKHPQDVKKPAPNFDTKTPEPGKEAFKGQAGAAELDAEEAARQAGMTQPKITDDEEAGVPQAMLDMSRDLQEMNASLINLGPQRTMQLFLAANQQEIG